MPRHLVRRSCSNAGCPRPLVRGGDAPPSVRRTPGLVRPPDPPGLSSADLVRPPDPPRPLVRGGDAPRPQALLARLKPRALVVAPGTATAELAAFARERLAPRGGAALVATPAVREAADVGRWLGARQLVDAKLSWRVLHAQTAGAVELDDGFEVCRVRNAILVADDGASAAAPPALVLESELVDAPHAAAAPRPARLWLSAKDVVLTSIKKKLAEAGIASRFQAGALVCAGSIVVRKASDDRGAARVVVDGPLCEDYYAVSRVVRNAFALV